MPFRDRINRIFQAAIGVSAVQDAYEQAPPIMPQGADPMIGTPVGDNCDTGALTPSNSIAGSFGWSNTNTGLGNPTFDSGVNTRFFPVPLIPYWEALALYAQGGPARGIVDMPVDDATNAGFRVDVLDDVEAGPEIFEYLDRIPVTTDRIVRKRGTLLALGEGEKAARGFRGGMIFLGLDDGASSPLIPLNEQTLKGIRWMRVVNQNQVQPGPIEQDPNSPYFGLVRSWSVISSFDNNQLSGEFHTSRTLPMPGFSVPQDSFLPGQDPYWPVSIYDIAYRALVGHGTTFQTSVGTIQKSTLYSWSSPLIQQAQRSQGLGALMQRVRLINSAMSALRLFVLGPGEELKTTSLDFRGFADMLKLMKPELSAAVNIPVTRLFGVGASGLSGDSLKGDLKMYAETNVEGHVQNIKLTPPLTRMIDLTMASSEGPTNGNLVPYKLVWGRAQPLSLLEEGQLRKLAAETSSIEIEDGVIRASEARESKHGGLEWQMDIAIQGPAPLVEEEPPELEDPESAPDDDEAPELEDPESAPGEDVIEDEIEDGS